MSQWLFKDPSTPSVRQGWTPLEERARRATALFWLSELVEILSLTLTTHATCATYLHRFWMRESMQDYPPSEMLAPALFLACKIEEDHRRLRDLINQVDAYIAKAEGRSAKAASDADKEEAFKQRRSRMLYLEDVLLKTLSYDLAVEHPFKDIVELAPKFVPDDFGSPRSDEHDDETETDTETRVQRLERVAWLICRDSLASTACVCFSGEIIAGACLLLAASKLGEDVPSGSELERIFSVDREDIYAAAELIFDLYASSRVDFVRSQAAIMDRPWLRSTSAAAPQVEVDLDDEVEEGELSRVPILEADPSDVKLAEEAARTADGQSRDEALRTVHVHR